jgi:hypothetical protein
VINYRGFTDRFGHLADGCQESSLDCIPLELVNFPAGRLALLNRAVSNDNRTGIADEFDIYFGSDGQVCDSDAGSPASCQTSGRILPP